MTVIKVKGAHNKFHIDQFCVLILSYYMSELKTGQNPRIFVKFSIIPGVVNLCKLSKEYLNSTRNAWQSLAYSPLGAIVSPPSEYM